MTAPHDAATLVADSMLAAAHWFDEVESTNTWALQRIAALAPLPCLVGTTRQSRGRGRGDHAWWATDGALTFSLVIDPTHWNITPQHWPQLSLATGLAVCTALQVWAPAERFEIKWPNDVYARGRKIAGILIETSPQAPDRLVVGIGVNVNNSLSAAPSGVRDRATSLIDLCQQAIPLQAFLMGLLEQLDAVYRQVATALPEVIEECRRRCLLTGRMVTVQQLSEERTGYCAGLDSDGALLLTGEAGPERFHAGSVVHWE